MNTADLLRWADSLKRHAAAGTAVRLTPAQAAELARLLVRAARRSRRKVR